MAPAITGRDHRCTLHSGPVNAADEAFVKRQKNDATDAAAIAEASLRPGIHYIAVKSAEHQARAAAYRTHQCFVGQRTKLINALRGHLTELGYVFAQGTPHLKDIHAAFTDATTELPDGVREVVHLYLEQIEAFSMKVDELTLRLLKGGNAILKRSGGSWFLRSWPDGYRSSAEKISTEEMTGAHDIRHRLKGDQKITPDGLRRTDTFFTTWCPAGTDIQTLVSVEGLRWAIEDSFETAKNELGLDHNETRSWHGWHRHVSLVILAFAMMAIIRYRANKLTPQKTPRMTIRRI